MSKHHAYRQTRNVTCSGQLVTAVGEKRLYPVIKYVKIQYVQQLQDHSLYFFSQKLQSLQLGFSTSFLCTVQTSAVVIHHISPRLTESHDASGIRFPSACSCCTQLWSDLLIGIISLLSCKAPHLPEERAVFYDSN